jgi:hypothetical protein
MLFTTRQLKKYSIIIIIIIITASYYYLFILYELKYPALLGIQDKVKEFE